MLAFSDRELAILKSKIIDRADLEIVIESAAKKFMFDWTKFYEFANWCYDVMYDTRFKINLNKSKLE